MKMIGQFLKRFMPKSLLGRSLLIIVSPLVLLQLVSGVIFYETHWDKVTLRLARSVAGDIAGVISLIRDQPDAQARARIFAVASQHFDLNMSFRKDEIIKRTGNVADGLMEEVLNRSLEEYVNKPYALDTLSLNRYVIIDVQLSDGVLHTVAPKKRLFSSTAIVFVLWMIGTSLVLFSIAMIFMRNQVRPIRKLAAAAKDFGKGRDVSEFKPEGAVEVRQAGSEFLAMRDRIVRQIRQRTDMLAGVSHDLRTPLTRMRLELEMLGDSDAADNLKTDVTEMEHMLEGYLAFARGEGTEQARSTNLTSLLESVVAQARRKGSQIDFHAEAEQVLPLRQSAFKRSITNVIDNASRFAGHVAVRVGQREEGIEIVVDDDGPGIDEEYREEVFKPFYRVEGSRNQDTGGIGLGLTITRDVIRGHGGEVELSTSPLGGLRVRIKLPV